MCWLHTPQHLLRLTASVCTYVYSCAQEPGELLGNHGDLVKDSCVGNLMYMICIDTDVCLVVVQWFLLKVLAADKHPMAKKLNASVVLHHALSLV